jgi:hypothetical protein
MRWQLGFPGEPCRAAAAAGDHGVDGIMLPEFYNSAVTMHGTIMVFFAIMPLLVGVYANYLIPLQIGAPDMAFPKLNMLSFWTAVRRPASSCSPASSCPAATRRPAGPRIRRSARTRSTAASHSASSSGSSA